MKKAVSAIIITAHFLVLTGCDLSQAASESLLTDNIQQVDNAALGEIALRYFIAFGFDMSFSQGDPLPYSRVYQYMKYGGVYRTGGFDLWADCNGLLGYFDPDSLTFAIPPQEVHKLIAQNDDDDALLTQFAQKDGSYIIDSFLWEIRPQLHQYADKDSWLFAVPSEIVDSYITGKFNTAVDRSEIKEYNQNEDVYVFEPFMGSVNFDLSIDCVETEDELLTFSCTAAYYEDVQSDPEISYRADFAIKLIDGEYSYIAVNVKESPQQ